MQHKKSLFLFYKKMACLALSSILCLGAFGCGQNEAPSDGKNSSGFSEDTASDESDPTENTDAKESGSVYTATYDSSSIDNIPGYQFFKSNVSYFFYAIGDSEVQITLTLEDEENYSLSSNLTNGTESDDFYFYMDTQATGTYTVNGDIISISPADAITYSVNSNGTMEALLPFCSPTGAKGEWDSTDSSLDEAIKTEILNYVPTTDFTVSGLEIISWKNPNEETISINDEDTVVDGDGGGSLILKPDHTAIFVTANQTASNGSWEMEENAIKITLSKIGPDMDETIDFIGELNPNSNALELEIDLSFSTSGQEVTILDFFEIAEDVWSALE